MAERMGTDSTLGTSLRAGARSAIRAGAWLTADLRAMPDLVVVGVKRGGTTSLFRDLERHPAMCPLVPSARRLPMRENMKGIHYLDSDMQRSVRWYRSHFATRPARAMRARRTGPTFTAEASPYYFFHPLGADRAAAMLPETTFVVMLRDPVERTISHWAEQTRNGAESLSLGDALKAEAARVAGAHEALAAGTISASHAHEQQTYAAQSEYAASYEHWARTIGTDRLVVIFSEDYYRQPAVSLRAVTDRLGVAPLGDDVVGTHRNSAPRHGTVDPELQDQLTLRFRPDVDRLGDLLGVVPPWPRFTRQ
jgi:hypothetical protein